MTHVAAASLCLVSMLLFVGEVECTYTIDVGTDTGPQLLVGQVLDANPGPCFFWVSDASTGTFTEKSNHDAANKGYGYAAPDLVGARNLFNELRAREQITPITKLAAMASANSSQWQLAWRSRGQSVSGWAGGDDCAKTPTVVFQYLNASGYVAEELVVIRSMMLGSASRAQSTALLVLLTTLFVGTLT
jgi:hypothetical protein